MTRFINPIPQYKPNSRLYFFESGTNTQLVTYKDERETIANTHPVLTDSAGFVPNIFFSATAKLVVLDENNVQYIERDPVGGSSGGGASIDWSESDVYGQNDLVQGSDSKYYVSLTNGNTSNDPTVSLVEWSEVRFIGVWNAVETYSIGDIAQTVEGNTWRAVTATAGNDPLLDDGTNWLPSIDGSKSPAIIDLSDNYLWIIEPSNYTAEVDKPRQIDASANTVDVSIPALTVGQSFLLHNLITSTFKVQILNPIEIIRGSKGNIAAGENMEILPGQSVQLVAESATVLSIVGALL